ncbi:MAG: SMI1/KNR4 family protein [Lachnospiraceae bacterium]|nr:SMI1/KNR4 family protein [Lachnospiraceae bacterium]
MNNSIKEQFDLIADYCKKLEDAAYDSYKLYSPVSNEDIEAWEKEQQITLPVSLKEWYQLSNGFDMGCTVDILPLTTICKCPFDDIEELEEVFIVGHYIGDGSMLVIDRTGSFYEYDHGYCKLYPIPFEKFVQKWIIENLEENMADAGLL